MQRRAFGSLLIFLRSPSILSFLRTFEEEMTFFIRLNVLELFLISLWREAIKKGGNFSLLLPKRRLDCEILKFFIAFLDDCEGFCRGNLGASCDFVREKWEGFCLLGEKKLWA